MVEIDESRHRGDTWQIVAVVPGDHSARKVSFTAKAPNVITGNRIIDLSNTAAGGSDAELTAAFLDGNTTFTAFILPLMTAHLTSTTLFCDFESTDALDDTDVETPAAGKITLIGDVRTPFDGIALPPTGEKFVALLASSFGLGDIVRAALVDGFQTFVGVKQIFGEVPTGLVDGTNKIFVLSGNVEANTESVFVGKTFAHRAEYSIVGDTITFVTAPFVGENISINYIKA